MFSGSKITGLSPLFLNANDEVIPIEGYNCDSLNPEILTISSGPNIIKIYYVKRNDLSYTVNYLEKGTNKILHVAKTVENQTYHSQIIASEEVITIDGYRYDSVDSETLTIGLESNVINIYYVKRNDLSYTVNYLEKGTNEVLHAPNIFNNQTYNSEITSSDKVIAIAGYNYDSADPETLTIGIESNVINLYYVKRNDLSYTVNYLEKGTNKVLHTPNTFNNQTYNSQITSSDKIINIEGYSYDSLSPEILTIGLSSNIINIYYVERSDYYYTVNYLEKDTNKVLHDAKVVNSARLNTVIKAVDEVLTISDYDYHSASSNSITIVSDASQNVLNLYYVKGTGEVLVKHIDKSNNQEIADRETLSGTIGNSYETNPNSTLLLTYNLMETVGNKNGTYQRERQEVIYYYQKDFDVITTVNGSGGTIVGDETVLEGEDSTEDAIIIISNVGYRIKSIKINNQPIEITNDTEMVLSNFHDMHEDKEIVVEFEPIIYRIVVKYLDELTGDSLKDNLVLEKHYQEEYTVSKEDFENYQFVRVEGHEHDIVLHNDEVIYYYHKMGYVKINHFDKLTNNLLLEETDSGLIGSDYQAHPKEFSSYVLDTRPDEETKEIIDGTITFNYYYKKISSGLIERHVDEYTNDLLDEKVHNGHVGDSYKIDSKTFQGYDLSTNRLPNNSQGTLKDELIEVVYYYKRQGKVIIRYQDEITKKDLVLEDTINKYFGDSYDSEAKEIPGYRLVSEDDSVSGIINEDEQVVIYYYRKLYQVITKVDGDGGSITGDEKVMEGYDSTKDKIKIKAFDGYYISKVTINGEEKEVSNHLEVTLNNFQNMHEDKEIIVYFEQIIHDVPKTSMGSILPMFAIGMSLIGGGLIFYGIKKGRKKKILDAFE